MTAPQAFVFWNAGVCSVIAVKTRKTLASSKHFRRATRKARRLGYDVRVYNDDPATAPPDARHNGRGSYILPTVPA